MSVTRTFYKETIRSHGIPLSLGRGEGPNDESLQAIRETEEMMRTDFGRDFTNARDLVEAALS